MANTSRKTSSKQYHLQLPQNTLEKILTSKEVKNMHNENLKTLKRETEHFPEYDSISQTQKQSINSKQFPVQNSSATLDTN